MFNRPLRETLRKVLLIAQRDYVASVRTKAFLVSIVIVPVMFGGSLAGIALLKVKPDIAERRVAVLDRTGITAAAIIQAAREKNEKERFDKVTGRQVTPHYIFETVQPNTANPGAQLLELSGRVRRGELYLFLDIGPEALNPGKNSQTARVACYTNSSGIDVSRNWFNGPVNDGLQRVRLARLGVDPSRFESLLASVPLERMDLVSRDAKTGRAGPARKKNDFETSVPLALFVLLGMTVLGGAAPMLSAIAEDKGQRVFEMLLGAATPVELMAGKVVAAVGRSLTSSVFYIIAGLFALQALAMMGVLPLQVLPWFFAYMIADVTILSAVAAALGAACSSPQDAQNLALLVMAPVMVPFVLMVPVLQQPNGPIATVLSLTPPFTPMLMLLRQAMPGSVPWWQPWAGLLGVLAFTLAAIWVAARIFRVTILLQGKTPSMAELARWAVRG